jgi:hypothetical protein
MHACGMPAGVVVGRNFRRGNCPNCGAAAAQIIDTGTLRPHQFVFTTRRVAAGQELLLNYGEVGGLLWPRLPSMP